MPALMNGEKLKKYTPGSVIQNYILPAVLFLWMFSTHAQVDVTLESGVRAVIDEGAFLITETGTDVAISSGARLIVNGMATLNGDISGNGELIVNSNATNSGSLILNAASTLDNGYTYNRYLTGNIWHLVSSPVGGLSIHVFAVTGELNPIAFQDPKFGLAPYNNETPGWAHFTTYNILSAGNFIAGKGYEIMRTSDGPVIFTGTPATDNVSIAISAPAAPGNRWNLVGNPFPSALYGNNPAHSSNNFLTVNNAALHDSYKAIYIWDAANSEYVTVNHAYADNSAFYIAPGQGFFVNSKAGGATINFTEAMQTHQTGNLFKNATLPQPIIKLIAERASGSSSTKILFLDGMTTALDEGYDAGRFTGGNNSFAVYTRLVGDVSNLVDFDIQCLPKGEYNHIIPVGLNAPANTDVVFRAEALNLPAQVPVYLEDRLAGKFYALHEPGSFYAVKITSKSEGAGRFFLHTNSSITQTETMAAFSEFTVIPRPQNNSIRVIGNFDNSSQVAVYDMAGRKLLNRNLNSLEAGDLDMGGLNSGVYIVTIYSSKQKVSKKISWIK